LSKTGYITVKNGEVIDNYSVIIMVN
jgi:hypothetical protein